MNIQELDQKTRLLAKNYLRFEKELLEAIIHMDKIKGYFKLGFGSLHEYCTKALELSPAQAYSFMTVARKAQEVPELKKEIAEGLSISKVQRMASVLNKENHKEWVQTAKKSTHRELERAVALANPKTAVQEKAKYVPLGIEIKEKVTVKTSVPILKLELGLSEKTMLKFRRAQDLECQRQKRKMDLDEVLDLVLEFYLEGKDPVRKAKRQKVRGKLDSNSGRDEKLTTKRNTRFTETKRITIPAYIRHKIHLRDNGQCRHKDMDSKRCTQKRYVEIHHIKPVSQGGDNTFENLVTLCSGHHKAVHLQDWS